MVMEIGFVDDGLELAQVVRNYIFFVIIYIFDSDLVWRMQSMII